MDIQLLADYDCKCGEGPLWHPDEKRVYWTDIEGGRMFWYDPATGKHEQFYDGPRVGGMTLQADGSLLLFMDKGMIAVWRSGKYEPIIESLPGEEKSRFNDVIADPLGCVFCGTMSSPDGKGTLYRLDTDGSIQPVVRQVGCSNGMGFTRDLKKMYFTDSWPHEIYVYDFDAATGQMSNRKTIVSRPDAKDTCDGMTMDENDDIWSAWWGAGYLRQFSPDGTEKQAIKLPASRVSCCVFGGEDYADMYVTTAVAENKVENDGALFRIRGLGVKGRPEFRSKVRL